MDEDYAPSQDVFADRGGAEVSIDTHNPPTDGIPLFQTEPLAAVPVSQRASDSFDARSIGFIEPTKVAGRRRGRRSITLSCPATVTSSTGATSTPLGFQWSNDRTLVELGGYGVGFQINPGDSATIESEAEVWVAPLPRNASGLCQYVECYDSPSGPNP
jgi:hypothetical protein